MSDMFADPLTFLTECHGRIRERLALFTEVARRLRHGWPIDRADLEAPLLFLATSGRGHTEDEEVSLFPRLRERLLELGRDVTDVDRLLSEHVEHARVHQELMEALRAIDPALLVGDGLPDPSAPKLTPGVLEAGRAAVVLDALVAAYEEHIPLEDDLVYPIAREVLTKAELDTIAAELRGRRRLGRKLIA